MSKKSNIILIGGGDFTKKAIRLISQFNELKILGYTDNCDKGNLFGVSHIGNDLEISKSFNNFKEIGAVICITGNLSLLNRKIDLINYYKKLGCSFPTIISKRSYVDKYSHIGQGVLVFDHAYIDFNVKIYDFVVINLKTLVCHDVAIGNYCTISPSSVIAGGSKILDSCFIGTNATVNPYLTISKDVIIGSGAVVNKSITEPGVYAGNPIKKIK